MIDYRLYADKIFGELKVLSVPFISVNGKDTNSPGMIRVTCECSCGNTAIVKLDYLQRDTFHACPSCRNAVKAQGKTWVKSDDRSTLKTKDQFWIQNILQAKW